MQQQEQQQGTNRPPTDSAIDAAVSLLIDNDANIVEVCRRQLLTWGAVCQRSLARAAAEGDARLRVHARAVLRSLSLRDWLRSVHELSIRLRQEAPDRSRVALLEEGICLLSAIIDEPSRLRNRVRVELDRLASQLRSGLRVRTAAASARGLAELMSQQEGFAGDDASYYELDNLLVGSVLDKRRGVPITLSVLYILVGRRAGISLSGMRMPDHFLVRVHGARPVILDPFNGGRTITKADCIRYLRSAGYGSDPSFVAEVDDRDILLAFVADLQRVFGYREDREICEILARASGYFDGIA